MTCVKTEDHQKKNTVVQFSSSTVTGQSLEQQPPHHVRAVRADEVMAEDGVRYGVRVRRLRPIQAPPSHSITIAGVYGVREVPPAAVDIDVTIPRFSVFRVYAVRARLRTPLVTGSLHEAPRADDRAPVVDTEAPASHLVAAICANGVARLGGQSAEQRHGHYYYNTPTHSARDMTFCRHDGVGGGGVRERELARA